jgi:hypothetical protein
MGAERTGYFSPGSASGGGSMGTGTRYASEAQLPKSMIRQRSLQNGRQGFSGAYGANLPQRGQGTFFTGCRT